MKQQLESTLPVATPAMFEIIDAKTLANRWGVPPTWVADQTRSRATDPIPHVKLGRYTKFEWYSPDLAEWWKRRRKSGRTQ